MAMEIQAAVNGTAGTPPVIETLLLDDPAEDELVIRVEAAGICHTDISFSQMIDVPRVLGHEGAGTIVAIGAGVTGFKIGDRVIATFGSCGACPNCDAHRPAYCYTGLMLNIFGVRQQGTPLHRMDGTDIGGAFFQQSSFATHALVTQRNLVKIPDGIDMVTAAPFGCGIQTGAGAVFNQLGALPDRPLLVVGAGAVGMAAVMAGRIVGCDPIIVVELSAERRELALELGAHHSLDGSDPDWVEQVIEITGGGATAALDTAGVQSTFEGSLKALHAGGTLGVVNSPSAVGEPVQHPGGLDFVAKTIVGVIEGDSLPSEFLPRLMAYYMAGAFPVDRLIQTFPFEEIDQAFEAARTHRVIKPVLTFASEDR